MEDTVQPVQSRSRLLLKRIILIGGIVTTATLILAACGGSDSQSQSGSETSLSIGERLRALAVPPAWRGRVPGPEIINGITVPPEPAPSVNNATLAGVDSNANGVRDDVERLIAKQFGTNPVKVTFTTSVAKALQSMLTAPSPATLSAYDNTMRCVFDNTVLVDAVVIEKAMLSTEARQKLYGTMIAGTFVTEEGC